MATRHAQRASVFPKFAGLIVLGAVLAGCAGGVDQELVAFNETPADRLYNEGLAFANAGRYDDAAERFQEIDSQHPYSVWARRGMVMTTFSHYRAGRYDDAIQAGRRFVTLHPGSEDAAYAQYLVALSYFNQLPEITRDQERTEEARSALQDLLRRYPDSIYAEDAAVKLRSVNDQLAGAEMNVGRYYLERRHFPAAINRFRAVVENYQQTRHVEEALMRLTESYMALGIVPEAQTAAAVLGHNFPDSAWYQDAYSLLQTGGVEPRENTRSWISRAFGGFVRLG